LVINYLKGMERVFFLLIMLASPGPRAAQSSTFDFGKLRYRDVPFSDTKAHIARRLGAPTTTTEPHYECGGLSSQEQNRRFYSLHYGPATYTGNARDSYVLEQVRFTSPAVALYYGAQKLTAAATLHTVRQLFNTTKPANQQQDGTTLLFISSKNDDGVVFTFKNGHLLKYEYWTPC
jgi:hypothetical protein